jgi:hypothetical protein
LIAKEAFIEYLFASIIEMTNPGIIKSAGFDGVNGTVPGFSLKAYDAATGGGVLEVNNGIFNSIAIMGNSRFHGTLDAATGTFSGALIAANGTFKGALQAATGSFSGELSAATGTFKGTLDAATLNAKTLNISSEHFSGTAYPISKNNNPARTKEDRSVYETLLMRPLKTLRVSGTGYCTIRLSIDFPNSGTSFGYVIYVNGSIAVDKQGLQNTGTIHEPDIRLGEKVNTIELFLTSELGYVVQNQTFQAMCRDNPGIFAYMS